MSTSRPIIVKGPKEGSLVLSASKEKVQGTFDVCLSGSGGSDCIVLYRLRVKESSILFSKTYGVLEKSKNGGSDTISIYADSSVATSGRLSTIRVEYLVITSDDAETVRAGGVDKNTCRPFFQRSGVRTYDVACHVASGSAWLTYAVIVTAVVAGVGGVVVVVRRGRGSPAAAPAAA